MHRSTSDSNNSCSPVVETFIQCALLELCLSYVNNILEKTETLAYGCIYQIILETSVAIHQKATLIIFKGFIN